MKRIGTNNCYSSGLSRTTKMIKLNKSWGLRAINLIRSGVLLLSLANGICATDFPLFSAQHVSSVVDPRGLIRPCPHPVRQSGHKL